MIRPVTLSALVAVFPCFACSSADHGGSSANGTGPGPATSTPSRDAGSPVVPSVDAAAAAAGEAGDQDAAPSVDGGVPTISMLEISSGVPAFASSSSDYQSVASSANDDDRTTQWSPKSMPAWIAYDLSGVPAAERQKVLVVWNAPQAGSYIYDSPPSGANMPTDYTIEINTGPGGTQAAPTTGWTQAAAVSSNLRDTVESPIDLGGANWVRMSITKSTDSGPNIDLDVYSIPDGADDAWMFMGDSITYITMGYAFSDLPSLVNMVRPKRRPAAINAAIGGTNTSTAVDVVKDTMAGFPGRYVVLAYGTNDNVSQGATFEMETLVQDVIAAGKVPVVPHMPWSSSASVQASGPIINQAIDALYVKYPQILRGPDLWAAFMNRTDLIPAGDVHPNGDGQEFLRQQWANVMAAVR